MKITVRDVKPEDLEHLVSLFQETVRAVNTRDYMAEQIEVWAPPHAHHQHERWQSMLGNKALVAEIAGVIVGFADLTHDGYLDRLFVHKDYQRCGIARLLVEKLESFAHEAGMKRMTT